MWATQLKKKQHKNHLLRAKDPLLHLEKLLFCFSINTLKKKKSFFFLLYETKCMIVALLNRAYLLGILMFGSFFCDLTISEN